MSTAVQAPPPGDDEEEIIIVDDLERGGGAAQQQAHGAGRATSGRAIPQPQGGGGRSRPAEGPAGEEIIDLTGSPDMEILSSTVARAPRLFKRPRISPSKHALLLQALQSQAAGPPPAAPPPEPPGPKCGICLDPMGGDGRAMAAGTCGHVYCRECLTAAVKATKKCPTCRKAMQLRQLHQVFINFS